MAPTVTATSAPTKFVAALIEQLADCPAFRTFTGAANATAAKARIHVHVTPEAASGEVLSSSEWNAQNPLCLIVSPESDRVWRRVGTGPAWSLTQRQVLLFRRAVPAGSPTEEQDQDFAFMDLVGLVIDEFCSRAGQPSFATFDQVTSQGGMYVSPVAEDADMGKLQEWAFLIETGEE